MVAAALGYGIGQWFSAAQISDWDSSQLQSVTVTIAGGKQAGDLLGYAVLNLQPQLQARVMGQDHALAAVAQRDLAGSDHALALGQTVTHLDETAVDAATEGLVATARAREADRSWTRPRRFRTSASTGAWPS